MLHAYTFKPLDMYIYIHYRYTHTLMYIGVYIYTPACIYMRIYIYRERDVERYIAIYIWINI